jgi:putative Holliday junction resolvase
MRYIGIDFGTKKVGLALSDEAGTMGFPHGILPNDERLFPALAKLIKEKQVGTVVIGESRDFTGMENPVAKEARAFGERIWEELKVPVLYEPEVLTTQEARRLIDGTRAMHGAVDASAASLILTSYLSRHGTN